MQAMEADQVVDERAADEDIEVYYVIINLCHCLCTSAFVAPLCAVKY